MVVNITWTKADGELGPGTLYRWAVEGSYPSLNAEPEAPSTYHCDLFAAPPTKEERSHEDH